ncbi:MAG: zinc metallopeptidase [Armatimonadota bacterium]|nr:zinc metallopeptidase [Armatimonadota bacterium]MDW8156894.1 zinc metallopeptidase [Armatimonadota bacterium]
MLFFGGPLFWLAVAAFGFALWAQFKVMSAFQRYSRVPAGVGLTGAQVAERILHVAGLYDVRVEPVRGMLSDHYDPRHRVLRLSPEVYGTPSVAALGVAAHEAGHALQHRENYAPLALRNAIVPVAGIGSQLGIWLFVIGMFLGQAGGWLMDVGILLFLGVVAFTLVTLPVEFDASRRAVAALQAHGLVTPRELDGVKAVLGAAALTYVAAAASAIVELLRLVAIRNMSRE